MNELIETIFKNFKVNGKIIPFEFLNYTGKETTYITYQEAYEDNSLSSDNQITNYISYYDIDIYSKNNYLAIVKEVKKIMKANGFMWQPSKTSSDLFEVDTGYYHKSLCFGIERNEDNG